MTDMTGHTRRIKNAAKLQTTFDQIHIPMDSASFWRWSPIHTFSIAEHVLLKSRFKNISQKVNRKS